MGSDGKIGFFPMKAGELQPQTSQKNTLDHLSLHYSKKFGQAFEFSKRNRPLSPTCLDVIRPVSSKKREQQVWQTTLTKHSPQISLLMKDCSVSWWASFSLLRSYRERGFCEPRFRGTMAKAVYSPGKLELQPQTRQKNTLLLFFFHYSKNLVKILSFLKETGCWPQLAGKTSDSIVSPIREIIGMAVNTYKTLCPDIFTHEKMLCVLDVSFMLLENCRES